MTTPQNELYNLSYKIKRLTDMFECEEDVFETVKQMQKEILDLMVSQQRMENQMALIIKLLSKDEKKDI